MSIFDYVLCCVVAFGVAAFGVLWFFADGMDPTGQKSGFGGCLTVLASLGALCGLIWLAVH